MRPVVTLKAQDGVLITANRFSALFAWIFRHNSRSCRARVAMNVSTARQKVDLKSAAAIGSIGDSCLKEAITVSYDTTSTSYRKSKLCHHRTIARLK